MYYLINTFNRIDDNDRGTVISGHRSIAAAIARNEKVQRGCKHYNGDTSYVPTIIVEAPTRSAAGYVDESRLVGDEERYAFEAQ